MDPIAAIATGNAACAIGIVRVSGEGAFAACDRVFRPADGRPLSAQEPRKMIYGDVLDRGGTLIDRGLAVRFPGPRSYTGEDCAEFDCHGSPVVLRELLGALFANGVRQAKAGEFTKRAFLNGRMDLTEAEAVADLIDAESAAAARNAAAQLLGGLRRPLEEVTGALLDVASRFYAVVDYPDEDIEDVKPADIAAALRKSDGILSRLLDTCERGKLLKSGVHTALIGRPNTGKSSLLNALLGFDRAIVTAVPGTTRDTVEDSVLCGGVLLRLTDTAGIRPTADPVEILGVSRAKDAAASAQLALLVLDGSEPLSPEDAEAMDCAERAERRIAVVNKSDLPQRADLSAVSARFPRTVRVSAKTGAGLDTLERAVADLFPAGDDRSCGSLLTDARQEDAVSRSRDAVRRASQALAGGLTPDAVLTDAEEALAALGELTGRTAREEIVSQIFSRFCVGK
jgi:tRNA modification GTPase